MQDCSNSSANPLELLQSRMEPPIYSTEHNEAWITWPTFRSQQFQIDSLDQDCSNSSALAMELLQSCTKPSKYTFL